MNSTKQNIRSLKPEEISLVLSSYGEKTFRLNQILIWLFQKGVSDFDEMKNIPANLRDKLKTDFYIDAIRITEKQTSKDKTTKVLFYSEDKLNFEGVLIPGKDRVTACISTQAGCPLNCMFCATGKLGFERNLSPGEIFDQVFQLNKLSDEVFNRGLSNIVIMGMGEPLLNYENTMQAVSYFCSETGLGMSPHRITLSTSGISPQIKKFADDGIKINLSVSLHSADNEKRNQLMPINKKYDLDSLKEALIYYYRKTGMRVTYEYLLLGGVNDSLKDASILTEFTKITPCKINLIEYNATENDDFKSSDKNSVDEFIRFIESKNLTVTLRKSKGKDINAACGQLANKKQ